jgi:PHP family Zn ribbon phosphoesterase
MREYVAELHVHTVLSPCAEIEMIPPLIVEMALERGVDLLAVTDHNATANAPAVQQAAAGTSLTVLPGMEFQTSEDVHLLCLFDTLDQAAAWQARVDAHLPAVGNNVELFGDQLVVDAAGDFVRCEPRLLLVAASLSLAEAVKAVHALGGLAIPAHVDRKAYGLLGHLGFVPAGLPVPALEISRWISPTDAQEQYPQLAGYPLLQNGDAHRLDEILGATSVRLEAPTVSELRLALAGQGGRKVWLRDADVVRRSG